jgi:hypothetical protein
VVRALPMVGRAVERDAMSAAYASAQTGGSQLVLITGQAGIGKTRLVEDLCANASDALMLTGESAPLVGTALAYGPFAAALRDHAGWLLEDDQSGDMLSRRHRLFVGVLEVLTELTARAPVLLVLEDMHWADESSLELLGFLTVRLREQPIMVVATLRDDELSSSARRWLAELERRPKVRRLRLAPLTPAEIGEVVADLMPADASEDAKAAVISAAEGIPLYARELATASPAVVPASITDAVLAKAAGVPAQARAVIDQVSVADGGMSHGLLAATVTLPEARLLAAARAAVDSGLLASDGDGYASHTHWSARSSTPRFSPASGAVCTAAWLRPSLASPAQTRACSPSTGIWPAARIARPPPLCRRRGTRYPCAHTPRRARTTAWPSNLRTGCRAPGPT